MINTKNALTLANIFRPLFGSKTHMYYLIDETHLVVATASITNIGKCQSIVRLPILRKCVG